MNDIYDIRINVGNGRTYLFAQAIIVAKGIVVYIGGGEKAHIGSTVMSTPIKRSSSENKILTSCTSSVINIPTHKDEIFARSTSEKLCKRFECTVCVTCGVHNDNITQEEMDALFINLSELEEQLYDKIANTIDTNRLAID